MTSFKIITNHPIAVDSPDHIVPYGVAHNNFHNQRFNDKLYDLIPDRPLRLMDLGCAGGMSVRSFLDQGNLAIGLEGSDFRKVRNMEEWNRIPDNLFTCDVTKPFYVLEDGQATKFDVCTAWEILEHIHVRDLPQLYTNIKNHLKPNGLFIVSICVFDQARSDRTKGVEWGPKDEYPDENFHHQWCVPREWWFQNLEENGFIRNDKKLVHFDNQFVRAPGINCAEDCTINLVLEMK